MACATKTEEEAKTVATSSADATETSEKIDDVEGETPEQLKSREKMFSQMRKCSNLYSETELLRLLSDYTADCVTYLGYSEDRFFSNVRLCLASIACCVAVYACFFLPPVADPGKLRISIIIFFGSLLTLLLIEMIYVKNAVASFKNKQGKIFFIDSHIDRRKKLLSIGVRHGRCCLTSSSNLGRFFDTEGYLLIDTVYNEVRKLLHDFERGMTDDNKAVYVNSSKRKKNL